MSQITSPHTDIFTSGIIHDTVPVLKFFQQLWSQNTKPCCYSVYLKPCATELQNSVFFHYRPSTTGFLSDAKNLTLYVSPSLSRLCEHLLLCGEV